MRLLLNIDQVRDRNRSLDFGKIHSFAHHNIFGSLHDSNFLDAVKKTIQNEKPEGVNTLRAGLIFAGTKPCGSSDELPIPTQGVKFTFSPYGQPKLKLRTAILLCALAVIPSYQKPFEVANGPGLCRPWRGRLRVSGAA